MEVYYDFYKQFYNKIFDLDNYKITYKISSVGKNKLFNFEQSLGIKSSCFNFFNKNYSK